MYDYVIRDGIFQSTLPARGATIVSRTMPTASVHFNPRSPHGERRGRSAVVPAYQNFNPRSPHGERHATPSLTAPWRNFNPRSPHGERRGDFLEDEAAEGISIHAPRTGSDGRCGVPPRNRQISIHAPRTGSDEKPPAAHQPPEISIHAPRTGSDGSPENKRKRRTAYFNPRSPHGERRTVCPRANCKIAFQSTLPARGATSRNRPRLFYPFISIHAPRTGSDALAVELRHAQQRFQSTLPARGATCSNSAAT